MRELKFRAYDPEEKRLIYEFVSADNVDLLNPTETLGSYSSVDENSVMQFTGLLDKNGKEIYEGDIVRMKDTSGSGRMREWPPREIKWEDAGFNITQWDTEEECEVIGNIYENKELLK